MKFLFYIAVICCLYVGQAMASGAEIVATARTVIGTPYSWGGGGWKGKSTGSESGAHTVGFDCSGLSQYSVYHGAHKKIARVAASQYNDSQCKHVPYAQHQPGDLVFFEKEGHIYHVAIISGPNTMIHAPKTNDHVREAPVMTQGRVAHVARCW